MTSHELWHMNTVTAPQNGQDRSTRQHLNAMVRRVVKRLSHKDANRLDFWLDAPQGSVRPLNKTNTRRQRAIICKSFQDPNWAKKVLDECYEA